GSSTIVIDPGPADETHTRAILAAARHPVSHIVLTHAHRDHSDGIAGLKAKTGALPAGFGRNATHATAYSAETSPSGG
ncbi:MBL fold metallo-hydrolase, partial [Acinetobacter baumannii]